MTTCYYRALCDYMLLQIQAQALFDFYAINDGEISFNIDDIITEIIEFDDGSGWTLGRGPGDRHGYFPSSYVKFITQVRNAAQTLQIQF